jgi:kinesin family protein 5
VLMTDNGRVRVAARLRPRNAEELILDADFNDCVELLPEIIFFYFPVCFMC